MNGKGFTKTNQIVILENRIAELEAEVSRLKEKLKTIKGE